MRARAPLALLATVALAATLTVIPAPPGTPVLDTPPAAAQTPTPQVPAGCGDDDGTVSPDDRFSLSATATAVTVTYVAGDDPFNIEFCSPGAGSVYSVETRQIPVLFAGATLEFSGLTSGTDYWFRAVIGGGGYYGYGAEKTEWKHISPAAAKVPGRPATPTVAVSGVDLSVSWSPPSDTGSSAITDYDVRFYEGAADPSDEGDWIEAGEAGGYNHVGTATTATIAGLSETTAYRVQVRARNGAGAGEWSDSGSATTGSGTPRDGGNTAASFPSTTPVTFTVDETAEAGTFVGWVPAADPDRGDVLMYSLDRASDAVFDISATGEITVASAPALDHERKRSYTVVVSVSDGKDAVGNSDFRIDAVHTVKVGVSNVPELPGAPTGVTASSSWPDRLEVNWAAPDPGRGPPVSNYEVRYYAGAADPSSDSEWLQLYRNASAANRAIIPQLDGGTQYRVQVRAASADGVSAWSASVGARTPAVTSIPTVADTALVSTIGQAAAEAKADLSNNHHAQGFRTDFIENLIITSVEVNFATAPSGVSVQILEDQHFAGQPSEEVVTLTNPAALTTGNLIFTVPELTVLNSFSQYWVVVGATSGELALTDSDDEDAGAADLWSVDNSEYSRSSSEAADWSERDTAMLIRINGAVLNSEPVFHRFMTTELEVRENNVAGQRLGGLQYPTERDDGDQPLLVFGLDAASDALFDVETDGFGGFRLRVSSARSLDYEQQQRYYAVLSVSDGKARDRSSDPSVDAAMLITINVQDVREPPAAPAAPSVNATSRDKLAVSWSAPTNDGPGISGYDVQYRAQGTQAWSNHDPGNNTSTTITGLEGGTTYQVQVRASNDEGAGQWSLAGSSQTTALANQPPAFSDGNTKTLSIAEDTASGATVGTVAATDPESDALAYSLDGTDAAPFQISSTGQITVAAGTTLDHETKSSYVFDAQVNDGKDPDGGSETTPTVDDTITVTVNVTDVNEPPAVPGTPSASAAGSDGLTVSWTSPATTGIPPITDHDVRWLKGTADPDPPNDSAWTVESNTGADTTATVTGLDAGSSYRVQVRARNHEGDSGWSASGQGTTASAGNPEFDDGTTKTLSVAENSAAGASAGTVAATDPDGDTLTYSLTDADAAPFQISGTGQITVKASATLDHEAKSTYAFTARVSDGEDDSGNTETTPAIDDTIAVTVNITDVDEPPRVPGVPTVGAASPGTLALSWAAADVTGKPAVTDHDVRWFKGSADPPNDSAWTVVAGTGAGTTATISSLDPKSAYRVQVRARNHEGNSAWSASGTGGAGLAITAVDIVSKPRLDASGNGTKDTYGAGQPIVVDVTWAEPVTWDVSPAGAKIELKLDIGGQSRTAQLVTGGATSGTASTLRFRYQVSVGDADTDGVAVAAAAGTPLITLRSGAMLVGTASGAPAGRVHAGSGAQSGHLVDGSQNAPSNGLPSCSSIPRPSDPKVTAQPGQSAFYNGLVCSDLDGDALHVEVRTDPARGTGSVSYSRAQSRLEFTALDHCGLEAATPALANPFTTTVTVRLTDPDGASTTSVVWFETAYINCPSVGSAVYRDAMVTLAFDTQLDSGSVPATGDFTVAVNGTEEPLAASGGVEVVANTVVLTLAREVVDNQTVTVSYTPGDNPLRRRSPHGFIDVPGFSDLAVAYQPPPPKVTSVALVSTPTADADFDGVKETYGKDNVVRARVTFDRPVDVVGTPTLRLQFRAPGHRDGIGRKNMTFDASKGTTNTTTLEFTYRVADLNYSDVGVAFYADKLLLDAGESIRATGTEADADVSYAKVDHNPGHQVDVIEPKFVSAIVYGGNKARLTFSEPIDPASAGNRFNVVLRARDDTEFNHDDTVPIIVGGTHATVTFRLFFGDPVQAGDTVKVRYSYSSTRGDPLRDPAGNGLQRFGSTLGTAATNRTANPPPDNPDPVFADGSETAFSVAENNADGAWVGTVYAGDTNADSLTYSLIGTDATTFVISNKGRITLKPGEALDYETKTSYEFTAQVSDRKTPTGATDSAIDDTIDVTVNVADVAEPPDAPGTPEKIGQTWQSVTVAWRATTRPGMPAITGYELRYKKQSDGLWTRHDVTDLDNIEAIGDLDPEVLYDFQVRATNDEGTSAWSAIGSGRTGNAPANTPPRFPSAATTRSVAENSAAGTAVGAPVTATDFQGDRLTYSLLGPDRLSFTVDNSGQIKVKSGTLLDHEAKSTYRVTLTAYDGRLSDTIDVTINVTDVDEPPTVAPAGVTPGAAGAAGFDVSWTAVEVTGRPPVSRYDVRYFQGTSAPANAADWTTVAVDGGAGDVDPPTSVTLTGLDAASSYVVQVRAANDEGDGPWSGLASISTATAAPPAALAAPTVTVVGTTLNVSWAAPDTTGKPSIIDYDVRYRESSASSWTSHAHSGTATAAAISGLTADTAYDVAVRAVNADGPGPWSPSASITTSTSSDPVVLVSTAGQESDSSDFQPVADFDLAQRFTTGSHQGGYTLTSVEIPWATMPSNPSVQIVSGSSPGGSVVATLVAPAALSTSTVFTAPDGTTLSASTSYWLVVTGDGGFLQRTDSGDEDDGGQPGWAMSDSSSTRRKPAGTWVSRGLTMRLTLKGHVATSGTVVNTAPSFPAGAPSPLSVAENSAPGTVVGTPAMATDPDNDTLVYSLGGPDAAGFAIDSSGQITVAADATLDHEAESTLSVMVQVSDGKARDGSDDTNATVDAMVAVTINVTDVDEPPPAAPAGVTLGAAGAAGFDVNWTAPGVTGQPPISRYDVRYFQGTAAPASEADWASVAVEVDLDGDPPDAGTPVSVTLTGLDAASRYVASVRAVNDEGLGPWSALASITTAAVASPPAAMAAPSGTLSATSMEVSWEAPDTTGKPSIIGY